MRCRMKIINLTAGDIAFSGDFLVPVSLLVYGCPSIAFLPAGVAESMVMLHQAGKAVSIEDPIYAGKLDQYTMIIFRDAVTLKALHALTTGMCQVFLTEMPSHSDRSKMI